MKTKLFFLAGAVAIALASSCTVMREFRDPVQADYHNPCTNRVNCEECRTWAKTYPKEYERYSSRMHARGINDFCSFPAADLAAGFYRVRHLNTWTIAQFIPEFNLFCLPGDGTAYYPSEFDEIDTNRIEL